jgi:hypothetical protein
MQQINEIGSKMQLITHLDAIADSETKTLRPCTKELKYGDFLPSNAVIKRTHSDCGFHVFKPKDSGRNWQNFSAMRQVPEAIWLAQTYIPALDKLGEWRVFIVGGEIIYTVHTHHKGNAVWAWEAVDGFYSLQEFRCVVITAYESKKY